jgi:probable HAF family extracellular repeat protein
MDVNGVVRVTAVFVVPSTRGGPMSPNDLPARRRRAPVVALCALALAAVCTGVPDAAGAEPATAPGVWVPVPGLNYAVDINNRGDILGRDESGRTVVRSARTGALTVVEVPGFQRPFGADLAEDGRVVGTVTEIDHEAQRPFVWSPGNGARVLPAAPGYFNGATATNERGMVVIDRQVTPAEVHAFTWTARHGLTDIGGGHPWSTASDVNDQGIVAGTYRSTASGPQRAFRWSASEGFTDIGTLGGDSASAHGVDRHGRILGTSTTAGNYPVHLFRWAPATGMVDLGTVSDYGTSSLVVNDAGAAAGVAVDLQRTSPAYRWTASSGFEYLGFPDPSAHLTVEGINDRGVIVANVSSGAGNQVYLWRPVR